MEVWHIAVVLGGQQQETQQIIVTMEVWHIAVVLGGQQQETQQIMVSVEVWLVAFVLGGQQQETQQIIVAVEVWHIALVLGGQSATPPTSILVRCLSYAGGTLAIIHLQPTTQLVLPSLIINPSNMITLNGFLL